MDTLRLVLLGIGALIVVGVVVWELHRRRRLARREAAARSGAPPPPRVTKQTLARLRSRLRAASTRVRGGPRVGSRTAARRTQPGPEARPDPAQRPGPIGAGVAEPTERTIEIGDLSALASAAAQAGPRLSRPCEAAAAAADGQAAAGRGPGAPARPAAAKAVSDTLLLAVTLMARPGEGFRGERIVAVLRSFDLEFGRMGLFHHYGGRWGAREGGGQPVFSVANVLEPGTFDLERMERFSTPGLTLFMQLPGPLDGVLSLELMVDVGRKLARELGGELRDARRSTLTAQGLQQMREQIVEHATRGRAPRRPGGAPRVLH